MSRRFREWILKARVCFRVAAAIDAAITTTQQARLELRNEGTSWAALDAARDELQMAEECLIQARQQIARTFKEHQPTADNREPEFWP